MKNTGRVIVAIAICGAAAIAALAWGQSVKTSASSTASVTPPVPVVVGSVTSEDFP